ncbi:MAG: hypothetical protein KGP28_03825 [Bdellovibrionales bacterium]|nr:hypothetical protein [Bdellovibrionales bacterium]
MALFSRKKKWIFGAVLFVVLSGQGAGGQAWGYLSQGAMTGPSRDGYFPMPPLYAQPYQTNLYFYGTPWGQVPPAYFYPSLTPFLGIPPTNFFMPHGPSPYGPGNFCPTCNPHLRPPLIPQQTNPNWQIMS